MDALPVVNLDVATIIHEDDELDLNDLQPIGMQLVDAFTKVGFVYITNHGIPEKLIEECLTQSKLYFELPMEKKMAAFRDNKKEVCGYIPSPQVLNQYYEKKDSKKERKSPMCMDNDSIAIECFDLNKPPDLKELIDLCHNCKDNKYPGDVLPNFKSAIKNLTEHCQKLLRRVLLLLGVGMNLQDPLLFYKGFRGICSIENSSQLRLLHYPQTSCRILPDQLRCGEHTDYGMLTFVITDTEPGLQVKTRQGKYVCADYIQDAILVNIGDLMQRWSGDILRSAKHRVVFNELSHIRPRYSLVYFGHTDDDVMVRSLSSKYLPVQTHEHMTRRFYDTFKLGNGVDQMLDRDSEEEIHCDDAEF